MNINKITYFVKVLAIASFIAICVKYFRPNEISFYLLLTPYLIIYLLSMDYHNLETACVRACSAVLSFILVPYLVFGVEIDIHAGVGILLALVAQLTVITSSEIIVLFFIDKRNKEAT
ncbi:MULTISPECIES: hypothetical protein [unclassified Pseudoalteromonas]|uniref:hypothetical protein n=1 Tax=unclassified Pseudoalteromonas TaxID=194690 RepID=UPI000C08B80D|nr:MULTISPECIES: hypothetical protein [unclassified Pseudoalteromonas]MDB2356114.1 hypothetical protein [Pseudoalteromonas sp.]MDP2636815.1 hypothetical protein [Pseudoalteromonas sp. 1_MG-2023]PHN88179.1 hypothetical protein CSC79_19265 [Pseudoalteromonas sp. 3D05]TGE84982.1 hypothetical protein C7Y70_05390 [Pseudoalteromonas sp. KS88]